ncbi:MAG: YdcF family protein, partial [Clostridia bacterium]|nr:YdcF family protein [Clostridia bacterium]
MKRKHAPRLGKLILWLVLIGAAAVLLINIGILSVASPAIVSAEEAAEYHADCILVLGAGVRPDGSPSDMLRDRIDTGIALYRAGAAPKLLMSGDHGRTHYDEVNAMRDRALAANLPSPDIFMDHAGFS